MRKFAPKFIFIYLIKFYRFFLSPFLPHSCRFSPSCSSYAIGAIEKFGSILGFVYASRRLSHCHPFSCKNHYDPLP